MNLEQLKAELIAAGINVYLVGLDDGAVFARFLENGRKRIPTPQEQTAINAVVAAHEPRPTRTEAAETAHGGARAWYEANPNAALLFELSIDDLMTEIDGLDFTALPGATRTRLRLLLKTLAVAVRVLAKREGLGPL